MKNRIILGIFAVVFCFFLAGCEFNVGEKKYSVNGINVTLEDGLVETDIVSQTVYLKGIDMEFTALKESFTDLEKVNITSENSLEDYASSEKNKDKYKPKFLEWSKTVSFDKTSN